MSDKDLKYTPIKDTKDFIIYVIRLTCNDKESEELILKEYFPKFKKRINKIKNRLQDKFNNNAFTSNSFQYKKSELFFIESGIGTECIKDYNKNIKNTESKEDCIQRLKSYLSTLFIDLGFMLYPKGYTLIRCKFEDIIKGIGLKITEVDYISYYHYIADKYAKKINNGLDMIYSYKDLAERIKGFSFEEWNDERAKKDVIITVDYFVDKYSKLDPDKIDTLEFFDNYFKLTVEFIEKGAQDLYKLIQDNNIKFN